MNKRLFSLACVLLLMAGGSVLLGFVMSLRAVTLQHVQIPPAATVHIDQPGTWLLWQAAPAVASSSARKMPEVYPTLTAQTGAVLKMAPTIRTIQFTHGEASLIVVGRFEVESAGLWQMDIIAGEGDGTRGWAIGLDPLPKVKLWSLLTVSAAIILLGGAACTGWISLRRPSNRALSAVKGPTRG